MNATTQTEEYPALTSLVISPNLQALLEFDDRLRESSKSRKRTEETSPTRAQYGRYPSLREQEVPTVSLPPPRRKRKKSAVQTSPKAMSEPEGLSSSTGTLPGAGEFGASEEVVFTMPEDIPEETEEGDLSNPYLNSPPSPRYFHQRSNDDDDQLSAFCRLDRSRSVGQTRRRRSLSDQSQGGQLVSPRFMTGSVGPRPRERGERSSAPPGFFVS